MKAIEAIKQIKLMLGMDNEVVENETLETTPAETTVELAEVALVDGTMVKVEGDFAEGKLLLIVTEEGDVPASEGKYETAEGKLITVDAEGIISAIEDMPAEEVEAEETQEFSSEDFLKQIADLIDSKLEGLNSKFDGLNQEFHAFKSEPAGRKITNNLNEVQQSESDLAAARFQKIMEFRNQTKK